MASENSELQLPGRMLDCCNCEINLTPLNVKQKSNLDIQFGKRMILSKSLSQINQSHLRKFIFLNGQGKQLKGDKDKKSGTSNVKQLKVAFTLRVSANCDTPKSPNTFVCRQNTWLQKNK